MKSLISLIAILLISTTSASFKYSASKTWTLKTFIALGQVITIQEKAGVQNGAAFNQIIIKTGSNTATFGCSGVTSPYSKTASQQATLMKFTFPPMPAVSMTLKAAGTMTCAFKEQGGKLVMTLSGSIAAKADEAKAGIDGIASITVGAKGTIVNISSTIGITTTGMTQSIRASGGVVSFYISLKMLNEEVTLWQGWSKSL